MPLTKVNIVIQNRIIMQSRTANGVTWTRINVTLSRPEKVRCHRKGLTAEAEANPEAGPVITAALVMRKPQTGREIIG